MVEVVVHRVCRVCKAALLYANQHCHSPNCIWCSECVDENRRTIKS